MVPLFEVQTLAQGRYRGKVKVLVLFLTAQASSLPLEGLKNTFFKSTCSVLREVLSMLYCAGQGPTPMTEWGIKLSSYITRLVHSHHD